MRIAAEKGFFRLASGEQLQNYRHFNNVRAVYEHAKILLTPNA